MYKISGLHSKGAFTNDVIRDLAISDPLRQPCVSHLPATPPPHKGRTVGFTYKIFRLRRASATRQQVDELSPDLRIANVPNVRTSGMPILLACVVNRYLNFTPYQYEPCRCGQFCTKTQKVLQDPNLDPGSRNGFGLRTSLGWFGVVPIT